MRIPSSSGGAGKMEVKRGSWTAEEDELLIGYIEREGEGRWRTLPKQAGLLRCGKSCRLRWKNYLRPTVKRGHITSDEEDLILRLHRLLGNRWSLIAGRIPGRTDNDIKNYWNSHLSKKLMKQGIDPKTHKPFHPKSSVVSPPEALHSSVSNLFYAPLTSDQDHVIMIKNEDGDLEQDLGIRSDEMINCFADEAFSAFWNSLISEDHRLDYQHEDEQE